MKLGDWFHRWRIRRRNREQLIAMAEAVLAWERANEFAMLKAKALFAALAERRPVRSTCFRPFVPKNMEPAEWVRFRATVLLNDREPNPMICDGCFETAISAFNPRAAVVGSSNSGPDNLASRRFATNEFGSVQ
jgi:hypothetical protein